MSLLDKFATVQIEADKRISEDDKTFCQRQQDAFDKSGPALQKIADLMIAVQKEQMEALAVDEDKPYKTYVVCDGFKCDEDCVYETMKHRNATFITTIVDYFARKYRVELDDREIMKHLIPAEPQQPDLPWGGYRKMTEEEIDTYKEKLNAYKKVKEAWDLSLRTLPLRYEQIVDEIFVQLGGFSFEEQAMNEFLERTWNCCHYQYSSRIGQEKFEIKNDVLRLPNGCYCNENKWMNHPVPEYQPCDDMKTLLDALAYYECGRIGEWHMWFPELYRCSTKENFFETNNMSKVKSIKLFKNGRVDIKFRNAAYVQEFAEQCLRRKPA